MNNAAADLRDVKPPVDIPGVPWLLWLVIALVVATIIFSVWYWLRHKHKFFTRKIVIKTAWQIAYERLADLASRDLFARGQVKEYFIELSDITRRYIEERFNIRAPEMTSEEFLNYVKNTPLIEAQHKDILKSFLNLSDLVKFARYGPQPDEAKQAFALAKQFVDQTKMSDQAGDQK